MACASRYFASLFCLVLVGIAKAQDPFEIHVYEYETLHRGQFTLGLLNRVSIFHNKRYTLFDPNGQCTRIKLIKLLC